MSVVGSAVKKFLSTPSVRRATVRPSHHLHIQCISIHALRAEGDERAEKIMLAVVDFYPRPPCGGRPQNRRHSGRYRRISIHALRAEGDGVLCQPS